MQIFKKLANQVYMFAESISSSVLVGYALKLAFHTLCNTLLAVLFIPSITDVSHMMLYLLYLSAALPQAKPAKENKKELNLLASLWRIGRKLFDLKNKASSFINSTFASSIAAIVVLYLHVNIFLALPKILIFGIAYLIMSSLLGHSAADTIFDLRIITLSLLFAICPTLLSGLALHAFFGLSTLAILTTYIHFNEGEHVNSKYNWNSLGLLALSLIDPLLHAAQYITAATVYIAYTTSLPFLIGRLGITLFFAGNVIRKALQSSDLYTGKVDETIPRPNSRGKQAPTIPRPAPAAA